MLMRFIRDFSVILVSIATLAYGSQQFIFSLDIPVYVPYSIKASEQRELIGEEYKHFEQKCVKHPKKREKHSYYVFSEQDFIPGKEPYSIDLHKPQKTAKKREEKEWRGFLKLYKPNLGSDIETTNTRAREGAKKIKTGQIISNLDTETTQINRLIQLFKDEAFGVTAEESRKQFSQKMQLTLLLNRVRSISATRNKSLKRYTDTLDNDSSVLLIRAFWEPKWVKRGTNVPLKEARHFFLEYLKRDPENAINFLIKNEGDTLGETLGGASHVPYRQLREAIRIHPVKQFMVDRLRGRNLSAALFEATHDSDLVQLRIQRDGNTLPADGLYSFYEEIIREYITTNRCLPPLVTTGYRAAYEKKIKEDLFLWLFSAIEEDRYIRQELSKIDPLITYYAEPNCLYYVPRTMSCIPYTFLGVHGSRNKVPIAWGLTQTYAQFDDYDPSESAIILHQLYQRYPAPVLVNASHPVIMKLPARMLLNKKTKTAFNLSELGSFDRERHLFIPTTTKALKVSENISQSPLAFCDYAKTVYNQLRLDGEIYFYNTEKVGYPNALFASIFTCIFDAYDPVELIEENGGIAILYTVSQTLYDAWPKRFKMSERLSDKTGNEFVRQALLSINRQVTHVSQKAELENLIDSIYGNGIFKKLYLSAKALGQERFNHIHDYFIQGLSTSVLKKSPVKIIEELIIKEELIDVKRELFHDVAEAKEEDTTEIIVAPFNFPNFSELIFQQVLNNLYRQLGGNKDAWSSILSVFGFNNESAFRSALNLKNTTEKGINKYRQQWGNAVINLPDFCKTRGIQLQSLFTGNS